MKRLLKLFSLTLLLNTLCLTGHSAASEEVDITMLDSVVVTATRSEKREISLPYSMDLLSRDQIFGDSMPDSLPDLFLDTSGVMVQKTANGMGSPYIRGFTAFRNILLIDGIRLNNSVFRDGPNQYWNTVDPLMSQRVELVSSPSSALYGSDAVGGAVQVITRSPRMEQPYSGMLYSRFSSAEESKIYRVEASGKATDRTGIHLGATLKDLGNIRAGDGTEQPHTGYTDRSMDLKILHRFSKTRTLSFAHNRSFLNDVWRTHKTIYGISFEGTDVGSELQRKLDQKRRLTYLQYRSSRLDSWVDSCFLSLSLHEQEEEQDRIRAKSGVTRRDLQGFDVSTVGLLAHFEKKAPLQLWSFGVEYYKDRVESFKREYEVDTGIDKGPFIQGPVGDDSEYDSLGIYLQNDLNLVPQLNCIVGARYTRNKLNSEKVEDPESGSQIGVDDNSSAVTGNFRLSYYSSDAMTWFTGISQSFRAPNLSDLTRLDTARSNEIETPVPEGLDPERFLTYDLGVKFRSSQFHGEIALFRTEIHDLIIRTPTGKIIGSDTEVTKKNSGDGYIHGFEFQVSAKLDSAISLKLQSCYNDGEVDTYPTSDTVISRETLSRLQPWTNQINLLYRDPDSKWSLEAVGKFAQKQDELSTRDQSDTQRIPPGGTPGYAVFHLRAEYEFSDQTEITLAIENLLDENYRIHGSGVNEPGRNAIAGLKLVF